MTPRILGTVNFRLRVFRETQAQVRFGENSGDQADCFGPIGILFVLGCEVYFRWARKLFCRFFSLSRAIRREGGKSWREQLEGFGFWAGCY
jgi:hypothetical protein